MLIKAKKSKGKFFEVKPFSALPCRTYSFKVKGMDAALSDFGDYVDGDKSKCDNPHIIECGCYERYFKSKPYTENKRMADLYNLTEDEYNELCKALEEVFDIGTCGWCT